MFGDFLKTLLQPAPAPLKNNDACRAMAALLVRVARSDGVYAPEEAQRIEKLLMTRYELGPFEAANLRAEAEQLEAEAPDTVRFTRALKEAVPLEERIGVIEGLWSVVLADGVRDEDEDALLRLVANLLGVKDQDSALARQRVEANR
ncbi:TerB family tellurite resistance protein [Celeribacter sp. HF31]|uniref:tellurite resistance TerB family protein n=1 Tax=Celeribacter sp. HF31 TaxID=2721558 RepID=UPI0014319EA4|nr:TerB family tellurite resistance protein [Celeribacter sp. HF31]NIY80194.1 TerB family tellurite resistance protein [Celeribacter sp. HF31]